jgi:ABC-type transport system involved in cytochrome bd biosynthesis fused ATPase/permease subunit
MVAVLPLAAFATFETVPGVPLAVARSLEVRAAAARLFALEDVPVPVTDPAHPSVPAGGVPALAFADAALRYDAGLPRALDGVSLDVPAGGRVAVTGSSGAGKSSLVTALLRFWPLEAGTLSLGGTDVEQLRQADARAACALADQRAQLFAGTVRSNLVLGRPDASDQEIADALAAARLTEWVAALPEGLETPVGEDGVAVSGGERRRLAVARALLAPGHVLVLDEPTSGLDPALADDMLGSVLTAAGERSVLVITHRAHEAARCDETVTLEAGQVVHPPA